MWWLNVVVLPPQPFYTSIANGRMCVVLVLMNPYMYSKPAILPALRTTGIALFQGRLGFGGVRWFVGKVAYCNLIYFRAPAAPRQSSMVNGESLPPW